MNYSVTIVEMVNRSCVVDVEANNKDEARAKVAEMWDNEEINLNDMEELESEVTEIYVN